LRKGERCHLELPVRQGGSAAFQQVGEDVLRPSHKVLANSGLHGPSLRLAETGDVPFPVIRRLERDKFDVRRIARDVPRHVRAGGKRADLTRRERRNVRRLPVVLATITAALMMFYAAATAQAEDMVRRIHDATIALVSLDRQMIGRLAYVVVPDFMYQEYRSLYLELKPFRDFHGRVPPIVREPVASGRDGGRSSESC
jgi:hypothetical protein